jgi:hypothetical protein|tara:strand:- start:12729 stop:12854 length:126 start_codon:yes stop_codon:yes gene_type:complete
MNYPRFKAFTLEPPSYTSDSTSIFGDTMEYKCDTKGESQKK